MSQQRPYLKYLIAGGVVCGEGGSLLPAGLEFLFMSNILFGSSFLGAMAITFVVIGSVSLCIGLPLLYKGVKERKLWLQNQLTSFSRYRNQVPLERPINQVQQSRDIQRRFCAACGFALPNLQNIKYCPKCGKEIL